jgi:hypothetical protein
MTEHKIRIRLGTMMRLGVAALTLFSTQLACGGVQEIDPCDKAFYALQMAASNSPLAGRNISENSVEFGPSLPGIATHPDVEGYPSWAVAVSFLDSDCEEKYSVEFAGGRRYDFEHGVTIRRKTETNFSLPEQSINWVTGMLTVAAAAALGIRALLGRKKPVEAY